MKCEIDGMSELTAVLSKNSGFKVYGLRVNTSAAILSIIFGFANYSGFGLDCDSVFNPEKPDFSESGMIGGGGGGGIHPRPIFSVSLGSAEGAGEESPLRNY